MTAPLDDPLRRVADLPPPVPGHLLDRLKRVFDHEPPVGDAIADVFRRAEAARRRRARVVLPLAVAVIALCTVLGYAVTAVLLPATPTQTTAADLAVARPVDPALGVLAPVLRASGLRVVPRDPAGGDGWRRYAVRTATGHPRGVIEISAYTAPDLLCFPVLAAPGACAHADRTPGGAEYVRYAFDRDINWQINEVIADRLPDRRVIVVQATGERGTGTAQGGRPPLTALLAARVATDPGTAAAFGVRERCNGPAPGCPVLKVPVPVRG